MSNDQNQLEDHDTTAQAEPEELMTLEKALALHYPDGPFNLRMLRSAVRMGLLPVSPLSKRPYYTTRSALHALAICRPITPEERRTRRTSAKPEGARPATPAKAVIMSADDKLAAMLGLPNLKAGGRKQNARTGA
jgi:hypothetical protein